jgi:glutamate synthase domain-containing protein 3
MLMKNLYISWAFVESTGKSVQSNKKYIIIGDQMGVVVFIVDNENKGKLRDVTNDDLISRQSITLRDASALSIDKEAQVLIIEGEDGALDRARELLKEIGEEQDEAKASEIVAKVKSEEEDAAEGVGFIFGD